ncbi:hypothetical protein [Desulfobacter postgatei]|uniref:hypothetical protein n=1 Tax=Desulfobacter postgatei TaxID=2293 RepID=UPI00259BCCC4|nr:hypothetical protein [uncultured Desulfobacter sp.]
MSKKWKTAAGIALIWMTGLVFSGSFFAQDLIIYPKEGQSQEQQQAQAQAQQQAAYEQNMSNFNRAYGACLESKGYTVK